MQVFVPTDDLTSNGKYIDKKRLNKQLLECCQILNVILDIPNAKGEIRKGWRNHPAVLAWRYNPSGLLAYTLALISYADERGIRTENYLTKLKSMPCQPDPQDLPAWWGVDEIHSSHRSRLLQKGFEELMKYGNLDKTTIGWYKQFGWEEAQLSDLFSRDYIWGISSCAQEYTLEVRTSKATLETRAALHDFIQNNNIQISTMELT
jgi:hypothetical protein